MSQEYTKEREERLDRREEHLAEVIDRLRKEGHLKEESAEEQQA
jgi:hypothetical protein